MVLNNKAVSTLPLPLWLSHPHDHTEAICFSHYMQQCLYHPTHGYYAGVAARQGQHGDYYTAPSMGRLFAHSFALHLAPILQQHPHWMLAEFGPGRGDLCCDLIFALAQLGVFPRYVCIEPQHASRVMQQQHCQQHLSEQQFARVHWQNSFPSQFCGIVIANEVLDAMACGLVYSDAQKNLFSLGVSAQESDLAWQKQPLSPRHNSLFTQRCLPHYAEYRYELPDYHSWVSTLSGALNEGCIYVFDYGYPRDIFYHPERSRGTLMCFYQHQAHENPLLHPGEQDISVHVEFTSLAETAHACGLGINLYTNLSQFLYSTVSEAFAQLKKDAPTSVLSGLHLERHYLLHPEAMGDVMKLMVLTKQRSWYDDSIYNIDLCHTL